MVIDAAKLPEIIQGYRDDPFQWGVLDCCLFAANVVDDLTGIDYAIDFRGTYRSKAGAAGIMRKHGGITGLVESVLGPSRAALEAHRGDFVTGAVPEVALGVCVGHKAVFKSEDGLVAVPLNRCLGSWPCRKP